MKTICLILTVLAKFISASINVEQSNELLLSDNPLTSQSIRQSIDQTDCPPHCRCHHVTIDCSNGMYDHIPKISNRTLVLEINSNKLNALTNTSLIDVTQLTNLSMSSNLITTIESKTFSGMILLESLDLSRNPIIELVDWLFSPLVNLKTLILTQIGRYNQATGFNIKSFVNASNVRSFKYDHNRLDKIPGFEHNFRSVFPYLRSLSLDFNRVAYIEPKSLLGLLSVQTLTLKKNNIEELLNGTFRNLPLLRELDLGNNRLRKIHLDAFCSENLYSLDLSQNSKIKLDKIFNCCPNVSVLLLSNCCTKLDMMKLYFKNQTKLTRLDLSDNSIGRLPSNGSHFFSYTNSQLNYLSLSRNPIRKLHAAFFEVVTESLKTLLISDCEITVIEESSLPHRLWSDLKFVDMSDNKYTCDCRLVWFRNWLNRNGTKKKFYKTDPYQYRCYAPAEEENVPLSNLTRSFDEKCFTESSDYCLAFVSIFVIVTSTTSALGSMLHRFRWHVRYYVYISKIKQKQDRQSESDSRDYEYDAFVIYCHEDTRWVKNQLQPHLETWSDLRFCIHDRDWELGGFISTSIVLSIEASRKSLLIVSNAFVTSNWCYFEMMMAQIQTRQIREDRNNFIIVMLEDVDDRNISPSLRLQMSRQTYIQWTNDGAGQKLFWARLTNALHRPSPSFVRSSVSRGEAKATLLPQ